VVSTLLPTPYTLPRRDAPCHETVGIHIIVMLLTLVVIPALYVIWIWQTDVKQRSVGEKRGTVHALPLQSS